MPETWIPNFQSLTDTELAAMARTSSDFPGAAAYVLQLRREIGDLSRRLRPLTIEQRQALYTLMSQWARDVDLQFEKVVAWVNEQAAAKNGILRS